MRLACMTDSAARGRFLSVLETLLVGAADRRDLLLESPLLPSAIDG